MPHSSGGGSGHHSGGGHSSHASSYHSSRSGGGSSGGGSGYSDRVPRFSKGYYAGAKRYRYYWRGQYRYFYSMDSARSFAPRPANALKYLPLILALLVFMFWPFLKGLKKYDRNILVNDRAQVLEGSTRLNDALNAFSEKTKITPAVITLYNEEWQKYYGTLEDYAYSQYLLNFQDEKHWLIVYSEPKEKTDDWEWFWEGMQGDDTDPVLTPNVTEVFNQTMQTGLVDEKSPVPDIIADAFQAVTVRAGTLRPRLNQERLLICSAILLCLVIAACFSMGLHRFKYRNAEYAPENFGDEEDDQYRKIPASLSAPAQSSGMQSAFGAQPFGQRKTEMDTLEKPQPSKPRFCRNCGMKNPAGTLICPSCGSRLE